MDSDTTSAENGAIIDQIIKVCQDNDDFCFNIPDDDCAKYMLAIKDYTQNVSRLVLSQLQPHFLFNVLNMIYYMCGKETDTARNMINDFATYLRANMNALTNPTPIPLQQEISHVHLYLRFEQMRFRDRFTMEYELNELNFRLPPLTLQPLVENAVRHGVCPLPDGGGIVRIESGSTGEYSFVKIIDNGVGFDVESTVSGGKNNLGLSLIRTRLAELCRGELLVHSAPGQGTIAEIRIPKEVSK